MTCPTGTETTDTAGQLEGGLQPDTPPVAMTYAADAVRAAVFSYRRYRDADQAGDTDRAASALRMLYGAMDLVERTATVSEPAPPGESVPPGAVCACGHLAAQHDHFDGDTSTSCIACACPAWKEAVSPVAASNALAMADR